MQRNIGEGEMWKCRKSVQKRDSNNGLVGYVIREKRQ